MDGVEKFKFGPLVPTPPYSEGEFYTVLDRNVSIECLLPALPSQSLVAITFNTSYMDNMKTANIQRQSVCSSEDGKKLETCNQTKESKQYQVCTIAVYDAASLELMSPPPNLPSTCEAEILALIDFPGHVARTGNSLQISLRQAKREQEGTYVCSILRTCNPPYNTTLEE